MKNNRENLSSFQFQEYIVTKSIYEINSEFRSTDGSVDLDFNLNSDFSLSKDMSQALVTLGCEVFPNSKENNKPYTLIVEIIGQFAFEGEFDDETISTYLKVNATAILFPYLRAFVSSITSISGMPGLILPTVNVYKMLEENEEKKVEN